MSSLMRPSGPLPPRVYWVRRILVIAVVVLAVALVWWLLGSRGGARPTGSAEPDAALSGLGTTTPSASDEAPTSAGPATDPPVTTADGTSHRQHIVRSHHRHRAGEPAHKSPLPPPTGTCDPSDVKLSVDVADAKAGQSTTATLTLTTFDGAACTLQITPASLVLRVTSGTDVLWTSDDCPNLLPARQVVVRADPAATYKFSWDGRRSVQGCESPGAIATPGGYWVEAALVGADVHKGYFDVTE
jgi:hypothetical protein